MSKPTTPTPTSPWNGGGTPTPAVVPGLFWPVDMSRVKIGPRFMGHYALGTYRKGYGYHTGQDFLGPMGLAVFAVSDGVVISSTPPASAHGYGNNILIYHASRGGFSRSSHLDSRLVKTGDTVKAGEMIGRLGMSGTDNPHLHFDWIGLALPNPRFNPHNPATGGVSKPLAGLDPIEDALTRKYFKNPLLYFNGLSAVNPVTKKVVIV